MESGREKTDVRESEILAGIIGVGSSDTYCDGCGNVPSWSLSALAGIFPKEMELRLEYDGCEFHQWQASVEVGDRVYSVVHPEKVASLVLLVEMLDAGGVRLCGQI